MTLPKVLTMPSLQNTTPARLQHVVFQTTEIDAMVAFYTRTLGFTVSDRVVEADGSLANSWGRVWLRSCVSACRYGWKATPGGPFQGVVHG